MPAQAHGQLQELAATLGVPGLLLGSAVGAIGLAGLLRRRKQPSAALAGAAVGTACVLAHAQVDWHWQVPAVALPVIALVACGAALHPMGAIVPRRAARIGGGVVLALALLWVLPGFAAERLMERAVANHDPGAGQDGGHHLALRPGPAAPRGPARRARPRSQGCTRGRRSRPAGMELLGGGRPAGRQGHGARRQRLRARPQRESAPRIVPLR